MDIFKKYAELRKQYPDDVASINAEEERVSALLRMQEYYMQEGTQALIRSCRAEIVAAKMKLATARDLTEAQRHELWFIIEAREWFIKIVAKNYEAEIEAIDAQLQAELERA